MATFVNNLRLKEITTGDEDGTWGTSTNTNLELITDGFSLGTKQMSADANQTFTMPDATADATRSLYLKITSAASLTATREVTLGPNTVSKTWIIENATTGSQIITIKQGSGATVNVANGSKVMIVTDGLGSGAAVFNASPTETATGDVTLTGTQTLTNKTLTSPVLGGITTTASGNLVLDPATQIVEVKGNGSSVEGQIKLNCHANTHGQTLKSQPHSANVTNTMLLPAGASSTLVSLVSTDTLTNKTINGSNNTITNVALTSGVTGTLPIANGGTNLTSLGSAGQVLAVNSGGSALEYVAGSSGTVTSVGGTGTVSGLTLTGTVTSSGNLTLGGTLDDINLASGVTGTLPIANGGTGSTSTTYVNLASNVTGVLPLAKGGTGGTTALNLRQEAELASGNDVQFQSLGVGTAGSTVAGEIRATNNITAYYSDDRLKTKLGLIEDALDKVNSLTGFYYEANETAQALGYEVKREVGVSAQEVEAIMPEVVAPAPIDDKYLTVRYEKLIPLLVQAIKELSDKVETLEAK
tara:strand:+ start:1510 stop:3093 length:1584 start_codon:yes stop_codon:yes gene_type:complete